MNYFHTFAYFIETRGISYVSFRSHSLHNQKMHNIATFAHEENRSSGLIRHIVVTVVQLSCETYFDISLSLECGPQGLSIEVHME